jgi:hypothetical protein
VFCLQQELENSCAGAKQQQSHSAVRKPKASTSSSAAAKKITDLNNDASVAKFIGEEVREFLCNVEDEAYSIVLGSGGCRDLGPGVHLTCRCKRRLGIYT